MKLKELASRLGLTPRGSGEIEIGAPASLEAAAPGTIIFVASAKYLEALRTTPAACAIVLAEFADYGIVERTATHVRLTPRGRLLSNELFQRLLPEHAA